MVAKTHDPIARNEIPILISAGKVQRTPAYNSQGEMLGRLEEVMIDKLSGVVAYAVLSFGGFLGMGDKHHPFPWQVLDYHTRQGGYIVDLDKETLQGTPSYGVNEDIDWANSNWGKRVHDYYEAPPYWN
jgi:hypothetical protein